MWKKLSKVLLLLSIVGVITGGAFTYWDYITEPLSDKTESFPNLSKVLTDAQDDVYVISHSKRSIVKLDAKGTLKYRIQPPDLDNAYITYRDMAVDSKGDLYVLQNEMDPAGLLVDSEEIVRYLPNGKRDPIWNSNKHEFKADKEQPLRHGVVMSLQLKDDTLYFFTYENGKLTLMKSDEHGKQTTVYQTLLPTDQYLVEVVGTDANNIVYSTLTGQMYKLNYGLLYPSANQVTTGTDTPLFSGGMRLDAQQNLYFIDQYGESVKKFNLATPSHIERVLTQRVASQSWTNEEAIKSIDIAPVGNLIIGLETHAVRVSKQNMVAPVSFSSQMVLYHYLFFAVGVLGLVCLVMALKILYVEIYPYSLFAKQMLVTVPLVLLAVGAIFYFTYSKYSLEVTQEVQRELIHMAHDGQNLINGDTLSRIKSPLDYMSADYQKITKNLKFDDNYGKFYTTVYKYENNQLYSIVDDNYQMFRSFSTNPFDTGVTCEERGNNDQWNPVNDYRSVLQKRGYITCHSSDADGNWLYASGPLFSADKTKVVGVYETGINTSAFQQRVDSIMREDIWMLATLIVLLILILVIGTRAMLKSVWKLQEGAGKMANEQWDVEVKITTLDEVAVLARTFNFMAQNIRQYIAATTNLSNSYKRFVPQQQLDMLGKPSILDVQLGDQVERDMSVLVTKIRSFHEVSKDMLPEESFSFMNKFLQSIAPAVRDQNGLINKYLGDGVLALFPDQPLSALQASIQMRQSLESYNVDRAKKGKRPIDIGIAIHKGPMVLGIIGEGQRLEGNVLSEDVNFVTDLEELSAKVGATLLIPAELMRTIDKSGQFGYRTLGLIQFAEQNKPAELCDVFEADLEAQKKLKAKTKDLFEQAVVMYQQGRFNDARERFLQVIKQNQEDKIAKLYFYQCDEYFQSGTSEDWQGTLDVT